MLRTDSASLRFFRQRIASFLSPRTDSASLRLVAEAIAVRDTRALVRSRSSVACVRAGDYAGNLTNWRENTHCAARPPASGATRPRRSRPAMQAGTATSRRRRCRLRPTFKGVMRCRMESPSDEAMRCRFAICQKKVPRLRFPFCGFRRHHWFGFSHCSAFKFGRSRAVALRQRNETGPTGGGTIDPRPESNSVMMSLQ